ncbi:MAG: hypothetical protein P8Y18_12165, partial [Candidatus Bathyarchaeota archaeon]
MEFRNNLEKILLEAKEKEKSYSWLEAIDYYLTAYNLTKLDFEKAGELYIKIGYCYFRAALQARSSFFL